MCLLDAGFMKLLCSLQAGDTAFLTGRCLLGTFRIKAAALGCGVTIWGHHKAPHLHLDSLANMKGPPPAPLSPAGLLGSNFWCQLHLHLPQKAEFLQDRTLLAAQGHGASTSHSYTWLTHYYNKAQCRNFILFCSYSTKRIQAFDIKYLWSLFMDQDMSHECPATPDSLPQF